MRFKASFMLLVGTAFAQEESSSSVLSSSSFAVTDSLDAQLYQVAQSAFVSGLELAAAVGVAVTAVVIAMSLINRGAGY